MKIIATVEARMASSRLPGKILLPLCGKPSLERLVERARRSRYLADVVIATTINPADDTVGYWARECGISVFRGSEDDVLLRVLGAARHFNADILVELTGDCPLIDPAIIDQLIELYQSGDYDYVSNVLERTYPRGLDTQVFSTAVLQEVERTTQDPADRENVSLYIYEHPERFKLGGIQAPAELHAPELRICVDREEDYEVVKAVYEALYFKNQSFTSCDVVKFLKTHPEITARNAHVRQKAVR